jgi:pseudouridine-5'-phosphate glycosidase
MMKLALDVARALEAGRPVVALESTLICHGIPKPTNAELAVEMERRVRKSGAVPATTAILNGSVRLGLSPEELSMLANAEDVAKCSTRDLPLVAATGSHGATTVAATVYLAARHGIELMATGGLGGVHLDGENSLDVSADLFELQRSPVAVVCCGVKSILDQRRTLEQLETLGVPVIGYGCRKLPAFYTAESDIEIPGVDDLDALVSVLRSHRDLGMAGGVVIAVPPPLSYALEAADVDRLVDAARNEAVRRGIHGPAQTPFMLHHMALASEGRTVTLNQHLAAANASLAGNIAVRLSQSS